MYSKHSFNTTIFISRHYFLFSTFSFKHLVTDSKLQFCKYSDTNFPSPFSVWLLQQVHIVTAPHQSIFLIKNIIWIHVKPSGSYYLFFRKLTHLMQNPELHHLAQLNNNTFDHISKSPLVLTYQKEKLQPLDSFYNHNCKILSINTSSTSTHPKWLMTF